MGGCSVVALARDDAWRGAAIVGVAAACVLLGIVLSRPGGPRARSRIRAAFTKPIRERQPGFFFLWSLGYLLALLALPLAYARDLGNLKDLLHDPIGGVLPLGVPVAGAFGAVTIGLYGIFQYNAPGTWDPKFAFWHLARPFVGAVLGVFGFFMYVAAIQASGSDVNLTGTVGTTTTTTSPPVTVVVPAGDDGGTTETPVLVGPGIAVTRGGTTGGSGDDGGAADGDATDGDATGGDATDGDGASASVAEAGPPVVVQVPPSSDGTSAPQQAEHRDKEGLLIYYVVAFIVGFREETFRDLIKKVTDIIFTTGGDGGDGSGSTSTAPAPSPPPAGTEDELDATGIDYTADPVADDDLVGVVLAPDGDAQKLEAYQALFPEVR